MAVSLHLYVDPLATPEQLSFWINQYKNYVNWIGILGTQPWVPEFEQTKKNIEVIKGQWYLAEDRNRMTSLTPASCEYVLWLYVSDLVRSPLHLLVTGKQQIDYISAQQNLEPDNLGRTLRYRFYPRAVAIKNFIWHGNLAPYLKVKTDSKFAINRKSIVESKYFDLPVSISNYQHLKHVEYEEIIELIVFKKLNLINSLPHIIELADGDTLTKPRRSLLFALAAYLLIETNQFKEAKGAMTLALEMGALNILHYWILAELAFNDSEYDSVIELAAKALEQPWFQSEYPIEPVKINTRLCKLYALAAVELKLPQDAKAALLEVEQFKEVADSLDQNTKNQLIELSGYKPLVREVKQWHDKSIVYFCGKGLEAWDDSSLETGIGGSEAAVIYLSREWSKAGYKVTVFGSPKSEHVDSFGVEWLEYSKCHSKDSFNIFISWRNFALFDQPVKAKAVLIDCHDLIANDEVDALRLARLHKLMVKSIYHRNNLFGLNDDQFAIIPNGVDLNLLAVLAQQDRQQKKIIYASSYDRGLEAMLRYGWPRIIKRHPDAELHIYYGWDGYDKMPDPKGKRAEWKKEMLKLMCQAGVFEKGRVGHKQLLQQKLTASIHYYGCTFEEIDCISVRESAAVGCLPVVSKYAALAEKSYVQSVEGDPKLSKTQMDLADRIADLLDQDLSAERVRISELARNESWEQVASKWIEIFKN